MEIANQAQQWFKSKKWKPFPFQLEAWQAYTEGHSGLINAPTGSGKTYSILLPALLHASAQKSTGLNIVWISPIRALTKEIHLACTRAIEGLKLDLTVAIRSGDTSQSQRKKQKESPPNILITTPESLHILMSSKTYTTYFADLQTIVVDEWHELLGSKRGVQTELYISRMRGLIPDIRIWGISATIGNMQEAIDVLLGVSKPRRWKFIKANIQKEIVVQTIIPREVERFPWAGHLGIVLIKDVLPIIEQHKTTLIFTNTRAQCEIWYQKLLDEDPDLAGQLALHHGSLSREVRAWVEEALYNGDIKAVVCTSSLDLGVDFRPVEAIVQIGSPKGVARFVQRAGRSGHSPGAKSKIFFLPTHSLELIEAAGLKEAIATSNLEDRLPYIRSWDVLIQYLMTLAVGEGMNPELIKSELKKTYAYQHMEDNEWMQILEFLRYGSKSLEAYDEYRKVVVGSDGIYRVEDKRIARKHVMSIGTIVSEAMVVIRYSNGRRIGMIEEYFMSLLSPGDAFWFAGRPWTLIKMTGMDAEVKPSKKKNGRIPSYLGGRISLSSQMADELRKQIYGYKLSKLSSSIEMERIVPLLEMQEERSYLPSEDEFLVEYFQSDDGYHLILYPFEGRNVHEGLGALIASRISRLQSMSISIGMNDYGVELLSDKDFNIDAILTPDLFSTDHLVADIQASVNAVEMARRRFRDIARISGLIFSGYPGQQKKERHLHSSATLLFDVFREYDPDNILYGQTYEEVLTFQLEEGRLRNALSKIQQQKIILVKPAKATPFSFPIMVDRLREKLTSESLLDRIEKMKVETLS